MKRFRNLENESGGAMLISLMILFLLTMLGTMFVAQTKTETQIAANDMRATQALYNAEAGFHEVLARMSDMTDSTNYIGPDVGDWETDPGWGRYLVLSAGNSSDDPDLLGSTETDGLDNDGDGQIDEPNESYPEVMTKQQANDAINYPWAKVRYKLNGTNQVLLYGDHDGDITTPCEVNLLRGYPVIVVTAAGSQGSASRVVEVEAYKRPLQLVESALYVQDDDFNFNGTSFLISGQDWDPTTEWVVPGSDEVPGIITTGDPTRITDEISPNQMNNVEGLGGEPSVLQSTVTMDLQAARDALVPMAETTISGGNYANTTWGGYDDYTVVHCTGDLSLAGGSTGGGVLIVDGDISISGSFTWYGLMLVLGDLTLAGGGSQVLIYGSTLIGGTGTQSISGNADFKYSSLAMDRLLSLTPYVVVNWREL